MKLDPAITSDEIEVLLRSQSEQVYGADRTGELYTQIEHLAKMLAEIAGRELDLIGPAPDTSGIVERGAR